MTKYRMLDCSRQYLPIRYPVSPFQWDTMTDDEQRAFVEANCIRVERGTFIDGETVTYGFGRLNRLGWWEYTCMWAAKKTVPLSGDRGESQ